MRAQRHRRAATLPTTPNPPVEPQPVDPSTNLAPMPDLGVDWPDPAKIDAAPNGGQTEVKGIAADRLQRYRVVLEGADPLGATFRTRFDQLSALVTNQSKPANARFRMSLRPGPAISATTANAANRLSAPATNA